MSRIGIKETRIACKYGQRQGNVCAARALMSGAPSLTNGAVGVDLDAREGLFDGRRDLGKGLVVAVLCVVARRVAIVLWVGARRRGP